MRTLRFVAIALLGAGTWASGCTAPSLIGKAFRCDSNADCAVGTSCRPVDGVRTCVGQADAAADAGVDAPLDTTPLRIGMPTVLQGVSADLGIEMKRGVDAWFKQVNAKGGIKGHKPLELVAVNDNYEPESAVEAMRQLLDVQGALLPSNCATSLTPPDCILDRPDTLGPNRVHSILGQVGTPTMVVSAPICIRNEVIYFAPFTGAQRFLRDGTQIAPVIFNYRASYYEETAAFVDYLFRTMSPPVKDHKRVIAFTQRDTFGDAGYNGFWIAYNAKIQPITATDVKRVNYTRNDLPSVDQAVAEAELYLQKAVDDSVLAGDTEPFSFGIFMVPTYAPAAKFIRDIKGWINENADRARLLKVTFMVVSFVGGDALVDELKTMGTYTESGPPGAVRYYGDGVWVAQVVPYYRSSLPGVVAYRKDLEAFDSGSSSWGSLEGYLGGRLFTEGLERAEAYDAPSMVKVYESIQDFDVGIGANLAFSTALPEGHQASHTVWLSRIKFDAASPTGTFELPWIWKGPVATGNQIRSP